MKLTQAILPVAGYGTRFLPWTKVVPKELLPIGNVPIIALLVDECMSVGIHDICFVISQGKEAIYDYFEPHRKLEHEMKARGKSHLLEELQKYNNVNFHLVYQNEMRGDGHALIQAGHWVKSDMLAVLFGDDLIVGKKNGLEQLVDAYKKVGGKEAAMLCLQNVDKKLVSKYGIVDVKPGKKGDRLHEVKGLVEKPSPDKAPSTLGIVGKYLIPKKIFDVLTEVEIGHHHDGEVRLIDGLTSQLGKMPIYGYEFEGKRLDTGTPEGYKEAVIELS